MTDSSAPEGGLATKGSSGGNGAKRVLDFAMGGMALALPVSLAATNVFWGVALLAWGVTLFMERRDYRWTGMEVPWLAGLGVALLAGVLSDQPLHSLRSLKSEVLAFVFLLAAQTGDAGALRRRLGLFAMGATAAACLGIFQVMLGLDRGQALAMGLPKLLGLWSGRAVGFFSHPITYAEMLLAAGTLILGLTLANSRRRGWAMGALIVAGILASQTRGVWLGLAFALGVWVLVRRDRKLVLATASLLVVSSLVLWLSPGLRGRAASMANPQANDSNRIRMGLWDKSLDLIRAHPVRGIGPGNLVIQPEELRWGGSPPAMEWTETHNMYLQMAVERGIPGLAVFLWFLAAVGRRLWGAARRAPQTAGVFYGFLGLLVAGLTESWTNDSEVVMAFYFLVGTAWALSRSEQTPSVQGKEGS